MTTALGTLFEEVNAKTASYIVRVAGQPLAVNSVDYGFAMGEVPTASFELPNPLPAVVAYSAPVEIYAGYDGVMALVFTGQVETPTPSADTTSVECSGISRKLRIPYKRLVRVINGQDANVIVAGMLDDAGVTNYAVNLAPWIVGAIVTTTLEFQTWDDAIDKVATVDGSPWYELPTGQIRVELRDPWPAPSYFRQYYSGDLRSLTDAQRAEWLAGTLALTAIQPTGVVNPLAQPRIRYGIKQTTLLSNVRNRIFVEGAVLDVIGPDGEATSARIEASAQNVVPWIPGGLFQDWTFDNELIDTQTKADEVAARKFVEKSRLDQRVGLQIDGDPEIVLGMTVNVEDPAFTGITGNWFVFGYRGRMDRSGYTLDLDLRGGVNAGITPLISPVADFIFANEYTPFAKVKQVTPTTNGSVIITFDGRSSFDPDGTIASWDWADDQGNTGTGPVIQFAYDAALSSINMTLTVTDNDGLTDSVTKNVNISTSADSCGDAGSCIIFAAIKTHMSVSQDGGASWTDISKAAALATGDFISVGQSNGEFFGGSPWGALGQPGDPSNAVVALYGTSAGEFYRTDDYLGSTTKYTIPSGRPIVGIWSMSPPYTFEWWFVADDSGNVYVFVYRVENGDYGFGLYHSDGKLTVGHALIMQSGLLPDSTITFSPLTQGVLVGGDSSDPDTMVRRVVGILDNQSSVGNTFGWGIGSPIQPSPIPPFDGALRAAILAAGPGHSAQSVAGFLFFENPAYGGPNPNISARRFGVMFTSGVDPRVWFHDGTAWLPATGLTPAINGKYIVGGFDRDFLLAALAQLKTFSADDGVTFVEGTTGSPSQINHMYWESGLLGVYLGAAASGLVKSLNGGDSWGYIRPHAGLGITWPVGAEGKQIAAAFTVPPPCPNIYALAFAGGSDRLLNLAGSVWQTIETTRSNDAFMLTYLGEGRMIHLVDLDVPQCSFDYGITWQPATAPGTFTRVYSVAVDAESDRVWALWYKDPGGASTSAICYSEDDGLTWTVSLEIPSAFTTFTRSIACHPGDKNRIAVIGNLSFNARTWTTTDRGLTWTAKAGPALNNALVFPEPTLDLYTSWITWSPYGRLIISTGGDSPTGQDLFYSDDAGTSWTAAIIAGMSPEASPMTHLFRSGPFGPYFALWRNKGSNGATTTPLYRSDDHGVHWVEVPPPTAIDTFYQSLGYDPVTNTLLLSARSSPVVYGLSPASAGTWSDLSSNFASPSNTGSPLQAIIFVGDPADAG